MPVSGKQVGEQGGGRGYNGGGSDDRWDGIIVQDLYVLASLGDT